METALYSEDLPLTDDTRSWGRVYSETVLSVGEVIRSEEEERIVDSVVLGYTVETHLTLPLRKPHYVGVSVPQIFIL